MIQRFVEMKSYNVVYQRWSVLFMKRCSLNWNSSTRIGWRGCKDNSTHRLPILIAVVKRSQRSASVIISKSNPWNHGSISSHEIDRASMPQQHHARLIPKSWSLCEAPSPFVLITLHNCNSSCLWSELNLSDCACVFTKRNPHCLFKWTPASARLRVCVQHPSLRNSNLISNECDCLTTPARFGRQAPSAVADSSNLNLLPVADSC